MKAIIIEDSDAANLLDLLKLAKLELETDYPRSAPNVDEREFRSCVDVAHRKFHYIVCRWLQEQGAQVVR